MRVESRNRRVPRAPLPVAGVTRSRGDLQGRLRGHYSSFLAHTGSCVRPSPSRRLGGPSYAGSLQVVASPCWGMALPDIIWVYPGFPTLFWGLSVFFVGDLMGKALWKLVENAARFPRRGGRVLCVHGAVSFHRARPCGPRWLPGRGAMRHVELDRRVLGLQSTGE